MRLRLITVALAAGLLLGLCIPATAAAAPSGVVVDAEGLPVGGVQVYFFYWPQGYGAPLVELRATTAANGLFLLPSPQEEQYRILVTDPLGTYREEWYRDATSYATATWVTNTATGLRIQLNRTADERAEIRGRVDDWETGSPLQGVRVLAYPLATPNADRPDQWSAEATSSADGTYRLPVLSGNYLVTFEPADPDAYFSVDQNVAVAIGQVLPGVDAHLKRWSFVSGRTVDYLTGELAISRNNWVESWRRDDYTGSWSRAGYVVVAEGIFAFPRTRPGRYTLKIIPAGGGAQTFLGGAPTLSGAAEFVVAPGASEVTSIAVYPGGTISVALSFPPNTPPTDVPTYALWHNAKTGHYEKLSLGGLPAIPVKLFGMNSFNHQAYMTGSGYLDEQPDVSWTASAFPEPLPASAIVTDSVNMYAKTCNYARARGDIRVAGSSGYEHVEVQAYRRDSNGRYRPFFMSGLGITNAFPGYDWEMLLPAGSYKFRFSLMGVTDVYNGGARTLDAAPAVTLVAGADTVVNGNLAIGIWFSQRIAATTVPFGGRTPLTFTVMNSSGLQVQAPLQVDVQTSLDKRTWRSVGVVSSAMGTGTATVAPTAKTTYVRLYHSKAFYPSGAVVQINRSAYLTGPTVGSSQVAGRTFSVTGVTRPRHTAGTKPVRLDAYRYESGQWRLRSRFWATAYTKDSSTSYYKARIRLTLRGRWRIRAIHPSDSAHVSTTSSLKYFNVK